MFIKINLIKLNKFLCVYNIIVDNMSQNNSAKKKKIPIVI